MKPQTRDEYERLFLLDLDRHCEYVKECIMTIANEPELFSNLFTLTEKEKDELIMRGINHDRSKREDQKERQGYIGLNMLFERDNSPEYGTKEYFEKKKRYDYVIQIHFKNNRHHPEHFENGVKDMSFIDKVEMSCDWMGAMISRNELDGYKNSLDINRKRFKLRESDSDWTLIKGICDILYEKYKNK